MRHEIEKQVATVKWADGQAFITVETNEEGLDIGGVSFYKWEDIQMDYFGGQYAVRGNFNFTIKLEGQQQ